MTLHREFNSFLKTLYEKRSLILQLTQREIKSTYTGSFLGPVWIVLEPLSFILILWLIFGLGLRGGRNIGDAPFIVYLASGLASWLFFSQTLQASTGLIKKYNFLVTKVDFKLGILPVVNILSSLVSHFILIAVILVISACNNVYPSLYCIQLLYYLAAACILLLGLGWMTSAVNVFIKDTEKVIGVIVRFGFFLTPIFWSIDVFPDQYQFVLKMNPIYYIVMGYRNSIIYKTPFWNEPYLTIYFWTICLSITLAGAIIFKRLRPHFAHVV